MKEDKRSQYFVVKRDEQVYKRLQEIAQENGRSAAQEALNMIKNSIQRRDNEVR